MDVVSKGPLLPAGTGKNHSLLRRSLSLSLTFLWPCLSVRLPGCPRRSWWSWQRNDLTALLSHHRTLRSYLRAKRLPRLQGGMFPPVKNSQNQSRSFYRTSLFYALRMPKTKNNIMLEVRSHVRSGLLWMADTTLLRDEGRTSERARETEVGE